MTALSILELVRVTDETDASGALNNARDLAAHAERWGYRRIWVAEHHNIPGIASAATAIVIAHMAAGSKTIRVDLCLCLPLRAGVADPGAAELSYQLQAVRTARLALCDGRCQHHRRPDRLRGAAFGYDPTNVVRQHISWCA